MTGDTIDFGGVLGFIGQLVFFTGGVGLAVLILLMLVQSTGIGMLGVSLIMLLLGMILIVGRDRILFGKWFPSAKEKLLKLKQDFMEVFA